MGIRGKKSSASLSIIQTATGSRPAPPDELTKDQAKVWNDVVATKPPDWWGADSFPLLISYCQSVVIQRRLAEQIDSFDMSMLADEDGLKRYDKLTQMFDRQGKLIANLATRMRLTQQSRYRGETAHTINKHQGNSNKPWQRNADNET